LTKTNREQAVDVRRPGEGKKKHNRGWECKRAAGQKKEIFRKEKLKKEHLGGTGQPGDGGREQDPSSRAVSRTLEKKAIQKKRNLGATTKSEKKTL